MSVLILTVFGDVSHYMDEFLSDYPVPGRAMELVNDIAFRYCEEPLIAPELWDSLDSSAKLKIRMSLRPPFLRPIEVQPDAIKIWPGDFIEGDPSQLSKLYQKLRIETGDLVFEGDIDRFIGAAITRGRKPT